ncbi:MAG TPA: GDSL-type esterase/lipase family protein [Kofleriaceae bacterium]|nr:GDSL-type esterase/lipase family protein [Kofleriaceae bacterium]
MSGADRGWTIAPTLLWFGAALGIGLWISDGGLDALADRMTQKREGNAPAAGPVFTAKPVVVADTGDITEPPPRVPADKHDRSIVGALEDVCLDGTPTACKRWGMDGFYKSIAESKAGKLGRAIRVSWYGDSVIATDAIPGRLRSRLQGELGDGGPGFVFVVPPHRFCEHEGVTKTASDGWQIYSISTRPSADGLYGVGGSSIEGHGEDARLKLTSGAITNVDLYYLAQPNGGVATISANNTEVLKADTKGDSKQPGYAAAKIDGGAKRLDITTQGKVRLFGVDLENATGIVVDNFGIVSVNVKSFNNHNKDHFAAELGHRSADLVMFMIGANEAQWLSPGARDTKDYQQRYEAVLGIVRKARPNASCLVVSPTDQAEAKDGKYPSRPVMPVLVEAQRKAAHAQGCAFYSTYDWMGGKGSASRWFQKGLVGSDFQHLSRKGANKMADAIHDALMAGYQRYASP